MKTLLKISLILVLGLFISMSVQAQGPYGVGNDATGTVYLTVNPFIQYTLTGENPSFVYDYLGTNTIPGETEIRILANVPWIFNLVPDGTYFLPATTGVADLPVSVIMADIRNGSSVPANLLPLGSVTPYPTTAPHLASAGTYDEEIHIDWALNFVGYEHYMADDYTAPVTYSITTP